VIPHEHGGWALLTVPFLLGTFAGNPGWHHLLLFMGWLLFYISTYAFKEWIKGRRRVKRLGSWAVYYGMAGLLFLIIPLEKEPALVPVAPLLLISVIVHIRHVQKRNERAMVNNLGAVHAFSMGAVAAYVLGTGKWDFMALILYMNCVIYFVGTVFFVKSTIRERKNPRWLGYAKTYHWFMLLVPTLFERPWLFIPYIYSLVRLYRWGGTDIKPIRIGMIEIGNAIQFLLFSLWLI
jgi:hypothetical protein